MGSVKEVLNNTYHHFWAAEPLQKPLNITDLLRDDNLSKCLKGLWEQFHTYSQTATKAIIGQTVALTAYHIRCLLEVNCVYLIMHSYNHSPGPWEYKIAPMC